MAIYLLVVSKNEPLNKKNKRLDYGNQQNY